KINNIIVIDQLNNPKKLNQYAKRFVTAKRYKQIEDKALFIPVTPALFRFLITTDIEKISETIKIIDNITGTIFRRPFILQKIFKLIIIQNYFTINQLSIKSTRYPNNSELCPNLAPQKKAYKSMSYFYRLSFFFFYTLFNKAYQFTVNAFNYSALSVFSHGNKISVLPK